VITKIIKRAQKSSRLTITKSFKVVRFSILKAGNIKISKKLLKCKNKLCKATRWRLRWTNFKKSVVITMYLINTCFSQRLVLNISIIININSTQIKFASQTRPMMVQIDCLRWQASQLMKIICKLKKCKVIQLHPKFKDKIQIIKNKNSSYNTF
jgi:hypothetical protein